MRYILDKDNVLKLADDECLVGFVDAAGEWFYMGDYDITYTVNEDVSTFDLMGRKMEAGDKGFAIKRIKYSDGTEKSVKVLVK